MKQVEKAKLIKFLLDAGDKYKDCNVAEIHKAMPNEISTLEGYGEMVLRGVVNDFDIPCSKKRKYSSRFEDEMKKRFDGLLDILSQKFGSEIMTKSLRDLMFSNEI